MQSEAFVNLTQLIRTLHNICMGRSSNIRHLIFLRLKCVNPNLKLFDQKNKIKNSYAKLQIQKFYMHQYYLKLADISCFLAQIAGIHCKNNLNLEDLVATTD